MCAPLRCHCERRKSVLMRVGGCSCSALTQLTLQSSRVRLNPHKRLPYRVFKAPITGTDSHCGHCYLHTLSHAQISCGPVSLTNPSSQAFKVKPSRIAPSVTASSPRVLSSRFLTDNATSAIPAPSHGCGPSSNFQLEKFLTRSSI
jgi:hypothetical protein